MHLVALGLNHNSATVELRECVAVSDQDLPRILMLLLELEDVREAVILSTCNRTELYVILAKSTPYVEQTLSQFLADLHGLDVKTLTGHLYFHRDDAAVEHLMRVASGLDSMMLGEYQIMSQVKSAYSIAQANRATDTILNGLFQSALNTGKRVRSETEISRGAFSVGAAAVEFATRIFGDALSSRSVLLVGAGQMIELTARHLQSRGASTVFVANRTHERAQALASQLDGAVAVDFDKTDHYLGLADIVICSTASTQPILTVEMVKRAMRVRRNRPLYLVDIAVPRDIDQAAGVLENVFLYNIDDLSQVVDQAKQERTAEVRKATAIVSDAVLEYSRWRETLDATPLILSVRERLESLRLDEMARLRSKLPNLSEHEIKAVEHSLHSLTNKIAHDAIMAIKESAVDRDGTSYSKLAAIMNAFGLGEKVQK